MVSGNSEIQIKYHPYDEIELSTHWDDYDEKDRQKLVLRRRRNMDPSCKMMQMLRNGLAIPHKLNVNLPYDLVL